MWESKRDLAGGRKYLRDDEEEQLIKRIRKLRKEGRTLVAIETPQMPEPRHHHQYLQCTTTSPANHTPACIPFHDLRLLRPMSPNKTSFFLK